MERLFSNSALLIPAKLHEAALREGFRPERRTAIYLIYDVIMQKCARMKGKWAYISDRSFLKVVKNHTRKSAEKKWLEQKGFIQIKKWRSKDGTLKNSKVPGRQCQGYKIGEQASECIWVDLWERELVWPNLTDGDHLCQYTREVLNLIEVDHATVSSMCLGVATHPMLSATRRMAILHWARVLQFSSGSIRRGRQVNRLYSPWTSAPRELRRACRLCSEPIVSIDLQASQPTFIGLLAQDDAFVEACFNDEVYGHIGSLFCASRDDAKPIFLSYVYGPNRKPQARNKFALAVQQYVAKQFPKTHAFIWQEKDSNYKAFARQLQNLEAHFFLDEILAEMKQKGIHALTAHDSVAVPESEVDAALEISLKKLCVLKGKGRLKVSNYGSREEIAIAI